jgi:hypothetical protein
VFVATSTYSVWFAGAALMGVGMALAYPNLITAVGDTADPAWRGGALGVYRLWRDGGYALGPLVLGGIAVAGGITTATWAGVGLVGTSGALLLMWLRKTDPKRRRQPPVWQDHPEWVAPSALVQHLITSGLFEQRLVQLLDRLPAAALGGLLQRRVAGDMGEEG